MLPEDDGREGGGAKDCTHAFSWGTEVEGLALEAYVIGSRKVVTTSVPCT